MQIQKKRNKIFIVSLLFIMISCFLLGGLSTVSATTTLNEGLVGYWNFDENSGSVVIDYSGFNHHGTLQNTVYSSGKYNYALTFNGINSTVSLGNNLNLTGYALTVSAWINPTVNNSWNQYAIFSIKDDASHRIVALGLSSSGNLRTDLWDSSGVQHTSTSDLTLNTGQWYLVGCIYNGTHLSTFVNTTIKSVTVSTVGINNVISNAYFGFEIENVRYYSGKIDEFRIYNRVLSNSEVNELFTYNPNYVEPTPTTIPINIFSISLNSMIIFVLFLIIDVIFSIKRIPIFAFIFGIIQLLICFAVMLPDSTFNIYLTLVFGTMAGLMIFINGLELRD
jgi:hypothetical protein